MQQIAVRAVNLEDLVTGLQRAARGFVERVEHRLDVMAIHGSRREMTRWIVDATRRQSFPRRKSVRGIGFVYRPPVLHGSVA